LDSIKLLARLLAVLLVLIVVLAEVLEVLQTHQLDPALEMPVAVLVVQV
jgi:hypothetical protein